MSTRYARYAFCAGFLFLVLSVSRPASAGPAEAVRLLRSSRIASMWLMYSADGLALGRSFGLPGFGGDEAWRMLERGLARAENRAFAEELEARLLGAEEDFQRLAKRGVRAEDYVHELLKAELRIAGELGSGRPRFLEPPAGSFARRRQAFLEGKGLEPIGFERLAALADSEGIASPEKFAALLPESMQIDYAAVFSSRSPQGATPRSPRLILSTPDGETFVGLGGDPASRQSRTVEVLQKDRATGRFTAKVIRFRPEGGVDIERDPKGCAVCHGQALTPIWDIGLSNDVWPGAYGAQSDLRLDPRLSDAAARESLGAAEGLFARFNRYPNPTGGRGYWTRNVDLSRRIDSSLARRAYAGLQAHPEFARIKPALESALAGDPRAGLSGAETDRLLEIEARLEAGYAAYERDLLRRETETFAYAGLKPGRPGLPRRHLPKLARLRLELDRFRAGEWMDEWAHRFARPSLATLGRNGLAVRPAAISEDSLDWFMRALRAP